MCLQPSFIWTRFSLTYLKSPCISWTWQNGFKYFRFVLMHWSHLSHKVVVWGSLTPNELLGFISEESFPWMKWRKFSWFSLCGPLKEQLTSTVESRQRIQTELIFINLLINWIDEPWCKRESNWKGSLFLILFSSRRILLLWFWLDFSPP